MPAYTHLTTAMVSNAGSNFVAATGGVTGTNITGTLFSNGLSLSVAAPGAGGGAALQGSGTYTQNTGTIQFSNSNGVTFGLSNNGVMTASYNSTQFQTTGAYLTTAMLSNAATISNINVSGGTTSSNLSALNFVNSNGVSWSIDTASKIYATVKTDYLTTAQPVGAYLTTARASNDAIGLNSALTANGVSMTANSSGLSLNFPAFLTTAMQSQSSSVFAKTGFASTTTNGSVVVGTLNTNGMTLAVPPYLTTAQAPGAYLTTARASNDAVGLNTAATNVTWTVNSSGISLNASAYLTTAMQTGSQSQLWVMGNSSATIGGTNISGTMFSNGMSLSVAAPGGGGGAGTNTALGLTNLTGTLAVNTNGVSLSISAAAPGGGGGGYSINQFENIPYVTMTNLSNMTATRFTQRPHFYPFVLNGSLTHNVLMFEASRATSGSNAFTMQAALYSMANSTQLSLIASLQNVFSNTATASISGIRQFRLTGWGTAGTALTPGQYVMMIMNSGTATASMNYSYRGGLTAVPPVGVILGGTNAEQTATSYLSNAAGWKDFWGNYTTTTATPPATVAKSHIQNWTSGNNLYFYMGRT